jgi:hypothetical protein
VLIIFFVLLLVEISAFFSQNVLLLKFLVWLRVRCKMAQSLAPRRRIMSGNPIHKRLYSLYCIKFRCGNFDKIVR